MGNEEVPPGVDPTAQDARVQTGGLLILRWDEALPLLSHGLAGAGFALSSGDKPALCSAPPNPCLPGVPRFLQDLHRRIDSVRLTPPLEDVRFHFGFNSKYLSKVLSYWRNDFDWKKQVEILNRYPHFKTKIEGTFAQLQLEREVVGAARDLDPTWSPDTGPPDVFVGSRLWGRKNAKSPQIQGAFEQDRKTHKQFKSQRNAESGPVMDQP